MNCLAGRASAIASSVRPVRHGSLGRRVSCNDAAASGTPLTLPFSRRRAAEIAAKAVWKRYPRQYWDADFSVPSAQRELFATDALRKAVRSLYEQSRSPSASRPDDPEPDDVVRFDVYKAPRETIAAAGSHNR